jgi:signal peptidase I
MSDHDPFKTLILELALAIGMIACLVGAMFLHTGSMPPLVVVESKSMIHEEGGEIGSIDAGDLILVHDQPGDTIVTFAEATDTTNPAYGYEQHGMAGDVIIYAKNGEEGTPIIHRAILRVVAETTELPNRSTDAPSPCSEGATYDPHRMAEDGLSGSCILTWSVPGTTVVDVENITVRFDGSDAGYYDCKRPAHSGDSYVVEAHLVVWQWQPEHEGMLTLGDNNKCSVDQGAGATNGSNGVHSPSGIVGPVRRFLWNKGCPVFVLQRPFCPHRDCFPSPTGRGGHVQSMAQSSP